MYLTPTFPPNHIPWDPRPNSSFPAQPPPLNGSSQPGGKRFNPQPEEPRTILVALFQTSPQISTILMHPRHSCNITSGLSVSTCQSICYDHTPRIVIVNFEGVEFECLTISVWAVSEQQDEEVFLCAQCALHKQKWTNHSAGFAARWPRKFTRRIRTSQLLVWQ
jgi:hypothetical protein